MEKYDLIIIGGGAAGFSAAIKADELGVKALLIDNRRVGLGGTCVNVGCVPTKYLLNVAKIVRKQEFEGVDVRVSTDFGKLIEGKNRIVEKLRKRNYEDVLSRLNVDFLEGNARFVSNERVKVDGREIAGKSFVICTGSSPAVPPIEGIDDVGYLTNIELLSLKSLPSSLAVIGGGALAVEMAQIFSRFGSKVYVFELLPRIVGREEPELSILLQKYLEEEGIEIHTNSKVLRVWEERGSKFVRVFNGGERTFEVEEILLAAGRVPNTSDIGLENTDVKIGNRREIVVNHEMQAAMNIWAAGDVTGEPMLETVAAREGMIAANNATSEGKIKMDYRVIPHAIFTDPQLASVGLTDESAVKRGYSCRCTTLPMEYVPKAQAIKDVRGAIKMVIDDASGEVLGVHVLSPDAADVIHEGVMILRNRMTIDEIIETVHVFPTLSEAIKIAAQSFKKDVGKMSCCVE